MISSPATNQPPNLLEFIVKQRDLIAQQQEQIVQLQERDIQQQARIEILENEIIHLKKLNPKPNIKPNTKPPDDDPSGTHPVLTQILTLTILETVARIAASQNWKNLTTPFAASDPSPTVCL